MEHMANNSYNEDSIQSLDARSHIQLRSGMYCGDTSTPNQLLLEVFSNSLDEHNIGHGDQINVEILPSGVCTVEDQAQGFIVGAKREDGNTILEASFSVINTSGKYSDDGVYEGSSLGLNGVGGKIATFLSEWLEVRTHRDGKSEFIRFEDGLKVTHEFEDWTDKNNPSGTTVSWLPSKRFFDTDKTQISYFSKFFDDISCLCPGLRIKLSDGTKEKVFQKEGIEDLINNHLGDEIETISQRFSFKNENASLAFTFTGKSSCDIISYVNYGAVEISPHITLIKSTLTRVLNAWARENNLLKEKEKNLDGASLQEGLLLVCNIVSKGVSYDAQTKGKIVRMDTSSLDSFGEELEVWLDNHPQDAKSIIEKSLLARKASEAAKKAREAVKNKKRRANKVQILHPDKLKDAEYLGEDSTLLVVEGLSAGSSMAVARDPSKFGILMLRGKLINALTNKEEKLLKNEEIQLLFKALNISPEEKYDNSKLRYGKVAICVDSDSDGAHISLLIMAALQHFCPQFIAEKRLCWLRSPLYIVKNKGEESYFFNDQEMNAVRGKIEGEVQRNKGLGSLSAKQARNSMFGENQHIDVLVPSEKAITLLEQLMGNDTNLRKDYIFNNIDFSEVRE